MATKTKNKKEGVVEAAVDAAEEIGLAASAFRESWKHVQAARRRGRPATTAVARTAKRAVSATKRAAKRAVGATKRTTRKTTRAVKKRR